MPKPAQIKQKSHKHHIQTPISRIISIIYKESKIYGIWHGLCSKKSIMQISARNLGSTLLTIICVLAISHCGSSSPFQFNLDAIRSLDIFPEGTPDEEIIETVFVDDPPVEDDTGGEAPPPPPNSNPDCDELEFDPGLDKSELLVTTGKPEDEGTIKNVPEAGRYQLFFVDPQEGPDSQKNESFYALVRNSSNPNGFPEAQPDPKVPNCLNTLYVVQDQNNGKERRANRRIFIGTFKLVKGDNTITIKHYCSLYNAGVCQELHLPPDGDPKKDGGCQTSSANSVHFQPAKSFCVKKL